MGAGSDIGGGASLIGTLSGGGTERVSVGRRSLVGANAGIGISLGDNCIVEAGLYVTASTPVTSVSDEAEVRTRGKSLSGAEGMLLIRHGLTGRVEAHENKKAVEVNEALHAN